MINHCELCRRSALERIYTPDGTSRSLTVHICTHCGLVQSFPRADRAARAPAAISSAADWGNVRYGKGFRTEVALAAIDRHLDLSDEIAALDVGSNRGSFAHTFLSAAPYATLTAVEPDERFASSCAGLARTELLNARIEDVALETARYDVVHSCHTLEHLAHPAHILADHWRVMKPDGLLVVDVPNIVLIGSDDIVEEWFIDKHLTHFSARTLARMIEAAGFSIVEGPDASDRENLLIVARKNGRIISFLERDAREVDAARDLMTDYVAARARNLMALTHVAAELTRLAPRRVALWGAGRLFDSLVVHGRFDARMLALLVDKHLKQHVGERHGVKLAAPEALAEAKPGVVVVMSRVFAGEIAQEANRLAPGAEVIFYSDLISRARIQQAA